ncbi:MAG TPA: Wzz/FepE/Etk N-terminal domain-containing protein [Candidatus Dormibacteraeota bacterium]|nr:Wzz/FepE/Etk N-terminal domain-containing protein [Candidatus Dormibacteraeota bacterium]
MESLEQSTPRQIDLRAIFWKVVHYRWVIAFPILAVGCAAFLYVKMTPSRYDSHVIISLGDRVKVSEALEPLVKTSQGGDLLKDRMTLLENRINSRPFLNEVAIRLGITHDPVLIQEATVAAARLGDITPQEYALRAAVMSLAGRIKLMPLQGSLVRLTATGSSPRSALNVASTIANLLLEENQRSSEQRAQARIEFSSEQSAVYEERLHKSEAALEAYQKSLIGKGISSNEVTADNVDRAKSLMRDSDEEIEQIRARLQSGRAESATRGESFDTSTPLSSPTLTNLEVRLTQLEINYALAALREEEHPGGVISLKSQIGQVRQLLFQECQSLSLAIPGEVSDEARNAAAGAALDRAILHSLRDKRDRVQRMVAAYTHSLVESPSQQIELQRLQAEVTSNRELLLTLRKEESSSNISEALENSQLGLQISVAEPAQLPLSAAFPDRKKIMGTALLLGALLSVGLVLGIERFGATLRSIEDAEREFRAPVIGAIPRVEGWPRPGSFLLNNWPMMAIMLVVVATTVLYVTQIAMHTNHSARVTTSGQHR